MNLNKGSLNDMKLFILDMDGTFYLDDELFDGSLDFIHKVKDAGKKFMFLTNNSSKGVHDYIEKLSKLGVEISEDEIFTSGEATGIYLKNNYPANKRYFVVGTDSLKKELKLCGLNLDDENPNAVILGYDTTITYDKLTKACLLLREGVDYIATHPDLNCPSKDGLIPDAGSFIALIKASTGREPDLIVGKPNEYIIRAAIEKAGMEKDKSVMVGDRLYTDIASAVNAKIKSVLVLTGETKLKDLENSEIKPTYVFDSIKELAKSV